MNAMPGSAEGNRTAPRSESHQSGEPRDASGARLRLPEGLRSLAHRDYRIFFGAQFFSLTGTWMQSLAQSWLVLTLTDSPAALGLIAVFQFGPTLILGVPAGVLVDRLPKRRILMVTQGLAAIVTALLAIQVWTGQVELWQIYAAAAAIGAVNALDMPTRQSFVVDLVGKDDLGNGIALNSALFNTTRIVGPALAGFVLAAFGPRICFAANAVSFIPVVAGLGLLRTRGLPQPGAGEASPVERLREGLAYARRTPEVLLPIILAGLMAIFGMNFNVWAPVLARDALDIGAGGFGLLMSSLGVGSLIGALTLAFTGRRPAPRALLTTALLFGTLEIALGLVAGLGLSAMFAMVLMAGIGFSMSMTMTRANTAVQTNTPDHLRGRVMSIYMTVFTGSTPIGAVLAGVMSDFWGAPVAVAAGGAVVAAIALAIGSRLTRVEQQQRDEMPA